LQRAGNSLARPRFGEDHAVTDESYQVQPIGWVESSLTARKDAPRQADEDAPSARIVVRPELSAALRGLRAGTPVLILTWLHQAERDVLAVHPRRDPNRPLTGVFATRSPDRPNPIGLHATVVERMERSAVVVRNLEAIDGTPVLDIKPVLGEVGER
jgi:tRNA-Thr(GGU) m(6)t(6)A37 methyltransferase TsaA